MISPAGGFLTIKACRHFLSLVLCVIVLGFHLESCETVKTDTAPVAHVEIDPFLQKEIIRILDIGNSYTDDATAFLPMLVEADKINLGGFNLYKAVRGGASFKSWYDVYNDNDIGHIYTVHKVLGESASGIPVGSSDGGDGRLFRNLISDVTWDLIIIHQVSSYAPYYDEWRTKGPGGYLDEFLSILKKHQPNAKLGFLLVHSYSSDYPSNKEKSSYNRWLLIADSVRRLCEDYDFDYIIPYGTAIQSVRSSSLNDKYDLTKDGSHCGIGLSRYTAACCYYESIIAPRTGVSVLGNSARYQVETKEFNSIDVTDSNAPIAQIAAHLATKNWYQCINPEHIN